MAEIAISITGPDDVINPCLDAFVAQHGWTADYLDVDGKPVSKVEFARLTVRSFLIDSIKANSVQEAEAAARDAAAKQTDGAIDLTKMVLQIK